jgi:hypothetical protein
LQVQGFVSQKLLNSGEEAFKYVNHSTDGIQPKGAEKMAKEATLFFSNKIVTFI